MRRGAFLFALLLALVALPAIARALTLLGHVEHYDSGTDAYEFTIHFSGPPDFMTFDSFHRQADSFQYWIVDRTDRDPLFPWITPDVVVRGEEIHFGAGIPVRDRLGGDGAPGSGGWGPIRGIVPFVLTGNTLTFTVPRTVIGDTDGQFAYYLGVFVYGATTDVAMGLSDALPVAAQGTTWGRIKSLYR